MDFFFGLSLGSSIFPNTVKPLRESAFAEITLSSVFSIGFSGSLVVFSSVIGFDWAGVVSLGVAAAGFSSGAFAGAGFCFSSAFGAAAFSTGFSGITGAGVGFGVVGSGFVSAAT